jgi:hypothetical protein
VHSDKAAIRDHAGVMLGLACLGERRGSRGPKCPANAGAGGCLDGRDKPDHDKLGINRQRRNTRARPAIKKQCRESRVEIEPFDWVMNHIVWNYVVLVQGR